MSSIFETLRGAAGFSDQRRLPGIPPATVHSEGFGVTALASGNAIRLETQEVYRLYAARVTRWAFQLGGPGVDVEDLVQEVFAIVHTRLPSFKGIEALVPWLYRITENVARHHRRQSWRRRWLGGSADEVAGNLAASEPLPPEQLESAQAQAALYAILNRLKERYRNVLILHELEGLSSQEIAALKGVPPVTIRVWLHRARAEFTRHFLRLERGKS